MTITEFPFVSIGMPVYNGGSQVRKALESLCSQTHAQFELIISDNHSQDETSAICQEWAAKDSRIRYFRQTTNIGPVANFLFVLERAVGPYFMWAAHDDWWFPEYVEQNLAVLRKHPDVVCSVSDVEFVDPQGNIVPFDAGTQPLMGNRHDNLMTYLKNPSANSRFYGLFRTEVIRECFRDSDTYWAGDWVIMARTLMWGKHFEVSRCLMRRGVRGMSTDTLGSIPRFNRTWLTRRFPMVPMTWTLLSDPAIPLSFGLLSHLVHMNVRYWRHTLGLSWSKKFRYQYLYPVLERLGLSRRAA